MTSKKIFTQFIFILSLFAIEQVKATTTYEVVNDTSGSTSTSTSTLFASKVGTGTGLILGIDSATTIFSTTTSVTLTAQANSGSTFTGWSNTCGTTTTCTLLMNTDRSISATFNLTPSPVPASNSTSASTPSGTGGGSVSPSNSASLPGTYYNSNNVGLGTKGTMGAAENIVAQSYIFKADLKLMQHHPEVIKLQQFLNNRSYLISTQGAGSKGLESDYFGLATKAALARFQVDNKIVPADGFFGNITKAFINRMNPSIPTQIAPKTQTQIQTAATSGKYIFTKTLTLKSRNPEVIKLQQFLNGKGYIISNKGNGSPGLESNYFGTATQVALARWQKDNGITPSTGYFGNITREVLNR